MATGSSPPRAQPGAAQSFDKQFGVLPIPVWLEKEGGGPEAVAGFQRTIARAKSTSFTYVEKQMLGWGVFKTHSVLFNCCVVFNFDLSARRLMNLVQKAATEGTLDDWVNTNKYMGRIEIALARRGEERGHIEQWKMTDEAAPKPEGEVATKGKRKIDKQTGGGQASGGEEDGGKPPKEKKEKKKQNTEEPTWRNLFALKRHLESSFAAGFSLQRAAEDPQSMASWVKALPEYPQMIGMLAEYSELCRTFPFWADLGHVANMLEMRRLHNEEELKSEFSLRKAQVEGLSNQVVALSDTIRRMLAARVRA